MPVRVSLINAFDTEPAFGSQRCNVSLDRVEDPFAVVALSERRYKSFTLDLSDYSVGQITFDVTADLCEVVAILNRNHQEKARPIAVL